MSAKILYAEDEPFLAKIVMEKLESKGYEVIYATDGVSALKKFRNNRPDLCLFDIMMPERDGYTLVEMIRKNDPEIPIIFTSAKSLDEDLVRGFKSGGNDYLRKPFSLVELLVRIEALLARKEQLNTKHPTQTVYNFGSCKLDTVSQQLTTPLATYDLSYKETALLELLIQHKNEVFERHDALMKIWGNDTIYNVNSMNVFMTHLRKLLKDDPAVQILSLRGIGYKLVI